MSCRLHLSELKVRCLRTVLLTDDLFSFIQFLVFSAHLLFYVPCFVPCFYILSSLYAFVVQY